VLLMISAVLLVFAAARELDLPAPFAMRSAVLALLGGHVLRQVAQLAFVPPKRAVQIFGDPRLSEALMKYLYLDPMPTSFALFAVVLLLCVSRSRVPPMPSKR
jgi:hypothetical protein